MNIHKKSNFPLTIFHLDDNYWMYVCPITSFLATTDLIIQGVSGISILEIKLESTFVLVYNVLQQRLLVRKSYQCFQWVLNKLPEMPAIGIWWFAVIDTEILCFFREILSFRGHRRYWDTVLFLKILSPDPKRRSWDTEILCFADGERYWDTVILSFARERKIPRYWDTEFRQAEKDTEILRYWASPGWERYWDTDMLSFSKRKIPLSSGKTI